MAQGEASPPSACTAPLGRRRRGRSPCHASAQLCRCASWPETQLGGPGASGTTAACAAARAARPAVAGRMAPCAPPGAAETAWCAWVCRREVAGQRAGGGAVQGLQSEWRGRVFCATGAAARAQQLVVGRGKEGAAGGEGLACGPWLVGGRQCLQAACLACASPGCHSRSLCWPAVLPSSIGSMRFNPRPYLLVSLHWSWIGPTRSQRCRAGSCGGCLQGDLQAGSMWGSEEAGCAGDAAEGQVYGGPPPACAGRPRRAR
jgi:hypothetical protein